MKRYVLIAFLILGVAGFQSLSMAADNAATAAPTKPTDVNNKFCPVSGEKIKVDDMGGPVTMEHNGKLYHLCCSMCIKDFKKDPDKYSKIADDEVAKAQAK